MHNKDILTTLTDPRGKEIILYRDTWEYHIVEGHPEMENNLENLSNTITDPDYIKEGRVPESEELYFKSTTVSGTTFTGIFASTREIDGATVIVTTAYEGNSTSFKGNTKWTKHNGEVINEDN